MKRNFGIVLSVVFLLFSCSSDDSPEPQVIIDDGPGFEITTFIADPVFEQALIDLDLDDEIDGSVLTSKIEDVTNLDLVGLGISDITGINDFKELENLALTDNNLVRLEVSANSKLKFVWVENNELTFINVQNLDILEKLGASGNNLSSMDISTNPALQLLTLADNEVTGLDVSENPQLNTLSVEGNPLTCIRVSQAQLDNIPMNWTKDVEDSYALDCE